MYLFVRMILHLQNQMFLNRKWKNFYQQPTIKIYKELTLKAAEKKPDLVVWPEAATPFYYGLDPTGTKYIQDLARKK